MRQTLVFILMVGMWNACKPEAAGNTDVLVTVDKYSLTRNEVEQIIPRGTSSADSLLLAESFVRKWIKDVLVCEVAERNIGRKDEEVNRLVEEYRRSLIRHRYQKYLIESNLSSRIQEQDKISYYEANQDKFLLDKNLIKGLFLKVPASAPGLDKIRRQYRSREPDALEAIEKFSMQHAVIYDYFYDRWIDFDEILAKIPVQIPHVARYLQSHNTVETSDSLYCYLLNIDEYLLAGNVAPYDYADRQIRELMINKQKVTFLKDFEEDLYTDAVRKGKVIFNNKRKND
ncbi:MAG: peptidyl-prolyl cis-trans isomerase [Tannerella sp.]|jgi:hypothetical protein|nr:peptidyl-prolyl cis-trans isomerase [Tannerella sp.]